ncbi:MAG: methylamine utilization protein [Phycisphaerae bacterium]|nr:MAG: methylamine utilization protein [Phycisphaerae bacterium]
MNGNSINRNAITYAIALLGLLIGACSPAEKESKPSASASPASTPTPKPAATPKPNDPGDVKTPPASPAIGTVKITARYQGASRPKRVVLNMAGNPACVQANNGQRVGNANLIVNKTMTVRNVICFVKDVAEDSAFEAPKTKALLDQKGCMYTPHVQAIMTTQTLTVRNSDATLHNIHTFAKKQKSTNFAQPLQGDVRDIDFKRPEIVKIKCDVHPWMSAYVGVFDHPYHAVTGKDGSCVIELPVGEYTIAGWHEETEDLDPVTVTISADKEAEVDIKVPG